jgi:hypothetical protein
MHTHNHTPQIIWERWAQRRRRPTAHSQRATEPPARGHCHRRADESEVLLLLLIRIRPARRTALALAAQRAPRRVGLVSERVQLATDLTSLDGVSTACFLPARAGTATGDASTPSTDMGAAFSSSVGSS